MPILRRAILKGMLFVGLLVVGFIYLLRGCLSKYDERAVISTPLYFKKGDQPVILALVKFDKTTSYSRSGGFVRKTVNTSYYLQKNDALTGEKLDDKKIALHSSISSYPIEVIAAIDQSAWLFVGELICYDPYTLKKMADTRILEERNPTLKGLFPEERKFIQYEAGDSAILLTMKNGSRRRLNVNNLILEELPDEEGKNENLHVKSLEDRISENNGLLKSLMEEKLQVPSRQLTARQISMEQYKRVINEYNVQRNILQERRDSLQHLLSVARREDQRSAALERRRESIQHSTRSFHQLKSNQDTMADQWAGLYTAEELKKLNNRLDHSPAYREAARRQFYQSSFTYDDAGEVIIDQENIRLLNPSGYFLEAGFLLDQQSALPFHLQIPYRLLIVYKDQIGKDGNIQLARINEEGMSSWTVDSKLKEWTNWFLKDNRLYVFGTDQKELSSGEINLLLIIDLQTGTSVSYDYFADQLRHKP